MNSNWNMVVQQRVPQTRLFSSAFSSLVWNIAFHCTNQMAGFKSLRTRWKKKQRRRRENKEGSFTLVCCCPYIFIFTNFLHSPPLELQPSLSNTGKSVLLQCSVSVYTWPGLDLNHLQSSGWLFFSLTKLKIKVTSSSITIEPHVIMSNSTTAINMFTVWYKDGLPLRA